MQLVESITADEELTNEAKTYFKQYSKKYSDHVNTNKANIKNQTSFDRRSSVLAGWYNVLGWALKFKLTMSQSSELSKISGSFYNWVLKNQADEALPLRKNLAD